MASVDNLKKFYNHVRVLRNSQDVKPFEDEEFPANDKSIKGEDPNSPFKDLQLQWLRPNEIWKNQKCQIFEGGIKPGDISQGEIGDCYLLCALASIAEIEFRIQDLLVTNQTNPYGIYAVHVCDMGQWKTVIVDDLFPCQQDGKLRFSQCNSKGEVHELWVMIVEKVWAKIFGSYVTIEAGTCRETLQAFTGAPTMPYDLNQELDKEDLWAALMEGETRNFIMTAGTDSLEAQSGKFNKKLDNGLISGHAYSLVDVYEVQANDKTVRLVKLRNPWGEGEWKGDWSDESNCWTPELKQKLNLIVEDEGIFYMSYEDFVQNLANCEICYWQEGNQLTSLPQKDNKGRSKFFSMQVQQDGEYFISVNQRSDRYFKKSDKYNYSNVRIVVARDDGEYDVEDEDFYSYVASYQKDDQDVFAICPNLTKGEYIVHIQINWCQEKYKEYCVSSYGPARVKLQRIAPKQNFLNTIFLDRCRNIDKSLQEPLPNQQTGIERPNSRIMTNTHNECPKKYLGDAYYYYYLHNQGESEIEFKLEYTGSKGVKFVSYAGNTAKVVVKPKSDVVVLLTKDSEEFNLNDQVEVVPTVSEFKQLAKEKGTEQPPYKLEDEDVVKEYILGGNVNYFGIFILWENTHGSKTFEQKIEFKGLKGLKRQNGEGAQMTIKLAPGEQQFVDLRNTTEQQGTFEEIALVQ